MSEYKTFGEMTKEERSELVEAAMAGFEIEFLIEEGRWDKRNYDAKMACFYSGTVYRIAPTKPSIDWSHVHPDYKWLVMDRQGVTFLTKTKPEVVNKGVHYWFISNGLIDAIVYASFKPGTCKPEDSLVMRPEGV